MLPAQGAVRGFYGVSYHGADRMRLGWRRALVAPCGAVAGAAVPRKLCAIGVRYHRVLEMAGAPRRVRYQGYWRGIEGCFAGYLDITKVISLLEDCGEEYPPTS